MTTEAGDAGQFRGAAGGGDAAHPDPDLDVFVSYASADAAIANAIVAALETHGLRCWIAPRDVVPGSLYADGIVRAINGAKVFVLVLSAHAVASGHVGKEVERASSKRRPIIAVRTDQAPLTPAFEYFLSESQWIDLGPGGVDADAGRLVEAVRRYRDSTSTMEPRPQAGAPDPLQVRGAPKLRPVGFGPNRLVVAALVIVALALAGLLVDKFWWSRRVAVDRPVAASAAKATAPASAVSPKSVAVLPFIDLSEKKDQEYFSDGLAEELIDLLAKIPDLKVTARTSSFSFRGRAVTVGEIGEALKVAHVLEGSVRKAGHTVRITAQLVRVDDGYHLWSETYDRDLKDVFKVQDDIARVVADKLKLTLLDVAPAASARTSNEEVHNLYLQGRYFAQSETQAGLEKAVSSFKRAIAVDPGYAPAWADLANAHFRQVANGYIPVKAGIESTQTEARKAAELDPALADPLVVIANVRMAGDADWAGARAAVDQALRLDPSSVAALVTSAHLIRATGNVDDSIALFRKALERDPLNLLTRRYLARVLYHAGQLADAEATARQVIELNPSFPAAHYELGRILLARGQTTAAVAEFEAEANPSWRQFGLPLGYHAQRRTAEANAALAALVRHSAGSEFQVAETFAFFGDADQAFAWLDRAVGNDPGILWVRGDPLLKGLAGDSRYLAFLHRIRLEP